MLRAQAADFDAAAAAWMKTALARLRDDTDALNPRA
jgi:hypothetical protein